MCTFSDPPNVTALEQLELVVNQTQTATFSCQAFGIPLPNITWIKVSQVSSASSWGQFVTTDIKMNNSSTLISSITLLNAMWTDQSEYICVGSNGITNAIGSPENTTFTLFVQGTTFTSLLIYTYMTKDPYSESK